MTELINLRTVRKRRAREDAERKAAANRTAHGVSRIDAIRAAAERLNSRRKLEQHKIQSETKVETGESR